MKEYTIILYDRTTSNGCASKPSFQEGGVVSNSEFFFFFFPPTRQEQRPRAREREKARWARFQRFRISSQLMKNNCDLGGLSTAGVKNASKSDKRLIWDEASEKANYTHNNTYEALSTRISDHIHTRAHTRTHKKEKKKERRRIKEENRQNTQSRNSGNPKWASQDLGSILDSSSTYESNLRQQYCNKY